jgi:nucleotide-binding universal stress UspA family protein
LPSGPTRLGRHSCALLQRSQRGNLALGPTCRCGPARDEQRRLLMKQRGPVAGLTLDRAQSSPGYLMNGPDGGKPWNCNVPECVPGSANMTRLRLSQRDRNPTNIEDLASEARLLIPRLEVRVLHGPLAVDPTGSPGPERCSAPEHLRITRRAKKSPSRSPRGVRFGRYQYATSRSSHYRGSRDWKGSGMQSGQSIVVGTDGSDTAERAVDRAGAIARAFGATIHVVSVYSDDKTPLVGAGRQGDRVHAQQAVDRAQERLAKEGVQSEAHVSNREAGRELVAIADETRAQMIVVGNRGMTGAKRLLGSVPNYVSHHAHCDVVIVRST